MEARALALQVGSEGETGAHDVPGAGAEASITPAEESARATAHEVPGEGGVGTVAAEDASGTLEEGGAGASGSTGHGQERQGQEGQAGQEGQEGRVKEEQRHEGQDQSSDQTSNVPPHSASLSEHRGQDGSPVPHGHAASPLLGAAGRSGTGFWGGEVRRGVPSAAAAGPGFVSTDAARPTEDGRGDTMGMDAAMAVSPRAGQNTSHRQGQRERARCNG
ncbi:hypothetical protein T484DRAFT_1884168 [Baffinella frigidus]|nr:hypothetical protein T484DRAFT_1884168 [Cryptophyta sp. CCMP2293]